MKSEEFLEVFNDIDESFIIEAAPKNHQRRLILPRVAFIAAVVALLTVSVVAVSTNIDITFGQTTRFVTEHESDRNYFGSESDALSFTTVDIDYSLSPVTMKERTYNTLTKVTTSRWKRMLQDEEYERFQPNGEPKISFCTDLSREFSSLEDVEEYLGIQLALTLEMREAAAAYMPQQVSNVVFRLCIGSPQRAEKALKETGEVTPVGIEICFYMTEEPEYSANGRSCSDRVHGYIFIPLDEEYVDYRTPYPMAFYEGMGPITVEEYTFDGQKLTLLYNDPQSGWYGVSEAMYSKNGIGYMISACDAEGAGDHVDMLMPFLENLE